MKLPLRRNLFFTGFMASGKTRIGSLTAASLGWKFIDTDKRVEEKTGKSIPEIFAEQGEEAFRKLEVEVLRSLRDEGPFVAALGGGTLLNPEAVTLVRDMGMLVGLTAAPEVILERVNRKKDSRPLLAGLNDDAKLEKIRALLAERQPLYDLSDLRFESADSIPHHILTRRIVHRAQIEELPVLWVELGSRRYPIYISEDLSDHIDSIADKSDCHGNFILISDQQIQSVQGPMLERLRSALGGCPVFLWKSGEGEKNMASIQKLLTWLLRQGFSRKTTLVAFGGGVAGDMVGFAASIFLRGVNFIQVPTTLLAMVDSSVGGKTGVNHALGKNLIGSFHQPKAVVISTAALITLPTSEFLAGLAEVVKYAVIRDKEFFGFLERNAGAVLRRETGPLMHIIHRCCALKAEIVGKDELEQAEGGRAILNYGHTFGHAFEFLSDFQIPHGHAVALGMRCAARLAVLMGMFRPEDETRHNSLLNVLELPEHFPKILDVEKAWEAMGRDKKASQGRRLFILPRKLGEAEVVINPPRESVLAALAVVAGSGV